MKKVKLDENKWETHYLKAVNYDYLTNKALDDAAKYLVALKGFNHMAIRLFTAKFNEDKYACLIFNGFGFDQELSLYEAENMTKEEIQERLSVDIDEYSYPILMEKV